MARLLRDETGKVIGTAKMESYQNSEGAKALFTGKAAVECVHNESELKGSGSASLDFTVLKQEQTGQTLLTDNAALQGELGLIKGKVTASDASIFGIKDTRLAANSGLTIEKGAKHLGKKLEIGSDAVYRNQGLAANLIVNEHGEMKLTSMDNITLADKGVAEVSGTVLTKTLTNSGKLTAEGATLNVDKYDALQTGELNLTKQSKMKGEHATLRGNTSVSDGSVFDVNEAEITDGGQFKLDATSKDFGSKRLVADGEYTNNGIGAKLVQDVNGNQSIEKMDQVSVGEKGKGHLNGTFMAVKMDVAGQIDAKGAKLCIDQLKLDQTGDVLLSEKTVYAGNTLDVAGKFKIEGESDARVTEVTTQKQGILEINNSQLHTTTINNAGHLLGDKAYVNAKTLTSTGEAKLAKSTVDADQANIQGEFALSDESVFKVQRTTIESGGKFVLQDSQHQGKSLEVKGEYDVQGKMTQGENGNQVSASIILEENLHIAGGGKANLNSAYVSAHTVTNDGTVQSKDLTVKATDVSVNGEWSYEGKLDIEAKNKFSTGKNSSMHGEGDSKFDLKSKTEDMQGKHSGRTMRFDVEELQNASGLIQGEGRFANIQTNNLGVKTKQNIVLSQNKRGQNTSLDIEAASITVNGDLKTAGLKLKATQGHVHIKADITAKANNLGGDGNINLTAERDVCIQGAGGSTYGGEGGDRGRAARVAHKANIAVSASGDVSVNAKGNFHNKNAQLSAGNVVSVKAKSITNQRSVKDSNTAITGKKVILTATDGDIQNNAAIGASEFLCAKANNGSVVNEAFQYVENGQYQEIQRYDSAIMAGGTGTAETGGIGIYIEADKKVVNDSAIVANGDVHVHGKEGVESSSLATTYVNNRWSKKEGYFGQTTRRGHSTHTDVTEDIIRSTHGKNVITSDNGRVDLIGTKILSPNGTEIQAKGDINIRTLKYEDRTVERKNQAWGLSNSRNAEFHQGAVDSVIATVEGEIRVISTEGAVNAKGTRFLGTAAARLIVKGKKDVTLVEEKMQHRIEESSAGFSIDAPGVKTVEGANNGKLGEGLISEDPLLSSIRDTAKANNGVERTAGGVNMGVNSAELYNQFKEGDVVNGLMNRYAKASLTYKEEKSETRFETRGPGGIQGFGHMHLESEEGNVVLGMDVNVDNATIKAKRFVQQSTALESSYQNESNSVSSSVSPAGVSYGAEHSHLKSKDVKHVNNALNVKNHLEVNADEWVMNGANATAGTLGGHVKHLYINDMLDSHQAKGEGYGASTDGTVSVSNTNESGQRVTQSSGLQVREGINKEGGPQFTADNTTFTGAGQITSDGENNYTKTNANIERIALEEYDRAESYSATFNPVAAGNGKMSGGSIGVHHKDYQATLDGNGRTVHNDEDYNVRVKIPSSETIKGLFDTPQEKPTAPLQPVQPVTPEQTPTVNDNSNVNDKAIQPANHTEANDNGPKSSEPNKDVLQPSLESQTQHPFDEATRWPNEEMFAPFPPEAAVQPETIVDKSRNENGQSEKPDTKSNRLFGFVPSPDLPLSDEDTREKDLKVTPGLGILDAGSWLDDPELMKNPNPLGGGSQFKFFQPAPTPTTVANIANIFGLINDWLTLPDKAPAGIREIMIQNMINQYGGCDKPVLHNPGTNPDRECAYDKAQEAKREANRRGPETEAKVNAWLEQLRLNTRPVTPPVNP
ncbi:MAG: hemagglutinin repeat-containing protein [Pseudomonadota bacterium]|nr:hemagglutinin repeat-containing protein [Pseudomonadota bacterium]